MTDSEEQGSLAIPADLVVAIHSLAGGGAERTAALLSSHWAARGARVTLLTLDRVEADLYSCHAAVQRIGLDLMRDARSRGDALQNNLRRLLGMRRAIKASEAKTVVSLTEKMNITTLLATRGLGVHVVIGERTDPRRHEIGRGWDWLRRRMYRRCHGLVVQTEALRQWARPLVPGRPVYVIPNAVIAQASAASRHDAHHDGPYRIVGLGRLARHKGFDLLLEAFRQIADKHPRWLVEVFGEGDQRRNLEETRGAWGLDQRILLPGWTRESGVALARADLFVLPSRYEGFPNALLEAMACGLASVSFACSEGVSEIVRSEVDGLLVPPEDVAALAAALDRLMSDSALRARLGERAKDVVHRFGSARFFRQWDAVVRGASEADVDALR